MALTTKQVVCSKEDAKTFALAAVASQRAYEDEILAHQARLAVREAERNAALLAFHEGTGKVEFSMRINDDSPESVVVHIVQRKDSDNLYMRGYPSRLPKVVAKKGEREAPEISV